MKIRTTIDSDTIPVKLTLPVRDLIDLSNFFQDQEIKNRLEKTEHYFVREFSKQLQVEAIKINEMVRGVR